MSETENNKPILSAEEFSKWYQGMADEIDIEARTLQEAENNNPSIIHDPNHITEVAKLKGKAELLEQVGDDFSDFSVLASLSRFLKGIQE